MIFFMGIIGYITEKKALAQKRKKIVWGLAILIFLPLSFLKFDWGVFLGINDLLKYMWIYALGAFFGVTFNRRNKNCGAVLVKAVASLLGAVLLFFLFASNFLLAPAIAFLMIGTVAVFSICLTETKNIKIRGIWKNTYAVFILSWPCQLIAEIILERLMNLPIYIIMPGMFLSGCIGPLVIIKTILRIEAKIKRKIFSPLLGM